MTLKPLFLEHLKVGCRGAWVAQLVKRTISAWVMISQFAGSSPTLGLLLSEQTPLWILCPPLSASAPLGCLLSSSLFLSQKINIKIQYNTTIQYNTIQYNTIQYNKNTKAQFLLGHWLFIFKVYVTIQEVVN